MAESRAQTVPSLYELSVTTVTNHFIELRRHLDHLPDVVVFDLYYQLYKQKRLCLLGMELSDLKTFDLLLKVSGRRTHLLQSFQALLDHGTKIGFDLYIKYQMCSFSLEDKPNAREQIINLGLRLGGFYSDAGCYVDSQKILERCKELCLKGNDELSTWRRILDCCRKLLHAQTAYSSFIEAAETYKLALETLEKLKSAGYTEINHAALYCEFSALFFAKSEYEQSYSWSIEALKQLKSSLPPRIIVDVLRQATKSCVLKREFQKAGLLSKQAVYLANEVFGPDHPKYSDALTDYGFYLLNYDSILDSVSIYKRVLEIRQAIFGKCNILVAIAHEDLAYAFYVHEYSTGKFDQASYHSNEATSIMEKLLPDHHLMLSSAKRVQALVLEEIALDRPTPLVDHNLLIKSESLHLSALNLAKIAFGERNVQTAKHYGNLGRLYQSMRKYEEAEAMHLKAISIKEELLGPEDFEVGLSIGHLASLYNFDMYRYRDAEKLYCRSIAIGLKLFGSSYSGLEYDYRGLLHVYEQLNEYDKISEYTNTLERWRQLRNRHVKTQNSSIDLKQRPDYIEDVVSQFFAM